MTYPGLIRTLFVMCGVLITSSCTYSVNGAHTRFTSVNVMSLQVGMSQEEVKRVFGTPTRISVSTCGGATRGGEWSCTMWEYDVEKSTEEPTKTNILTFNSSVNPPRLNDWKINRMWN